MTYDELCGRIANWLNRGDLEAQIPEFIALAEARLQKERRVRELSCRGKFTITQDGDALPADFRALSAWYHDAGPGLGGPIVIVGAEQLPAVKARLGGTGAPKYAAISDGRLYYAPVPNDVYETRMSYFRTIPRLGPERQTNWLLEDHEDIYLWASLAEAAPYLVDDERVVLWEAKLESAVEGLYQTNWDAQWSGTMRQGIRRVIGG